jgi:metal-responsive CopG/Arc/MetJ family transcriptional regulator
MANGLALYEEQVYFYGRPMVKKKIITKYGDIKLSEELIKKIDDYLHSDAGRLLGYASRADFVATTIRAYLEKNVETVEIPIELVKQVDAVVKNQLHGYRSKEEFVRDAIRRRLEELKKSPLEK